MRPDTGLDSSTLGSWPAQKSKIRRSTDWASYFILTSFQVDIIVAILQRRHLRLTEVKYLIWYQKTNIIRRCASESILLISNLVSMVAGFPKFFRFLIVGPGDWGWGQGWIGSAVITREFQKGAKERRPGRGQEDLAKSDVSEGSSAPCIALQFCPAFSLYKFYMKRHRNTFQSV